MRYVLVTLALVLCALPASAAWNNCNTPGVATAVGDIVVPKTRSRLACHDTAPGTATDSTLLDVSQCDHIDIWFDPDIAGVTHVAEAQLYRCAMKSINANWCTKMLVDTDADGIPNDVTLDGYTIGRQGQQGQTAVWIYVDMTVAPGAGLIARTMVTCY